MKLKKIKEIVLKQNLPKNVFRKKLSFILSTLIDLENPPTSFNDLHRKLVSIKYLIKNSKYWTLKFQAFQSIVNQIVFIFNVCKIFLELENDRNYMSVCDTFHISFLPLDVSFVLVSLHLLHGAPFGSYRLRYRCQRVVNRWYSVYWKICAVPYRALNLVATGQKNQLLCKVNC